MLYSNILTEAEAKWCEHYLREAQKFMEKADNKFTSNLYRDLLTHCYHRICDCLFRENREFEVYKNVLGYCDKVLDMYPNDEKAHFYKALAYMKLRNYKEALELLESCRINCDLQIAECKRQLGIEPEIGAEANAQENLIREIEKLEINAE